MTVGFSTTTANGNYIQISEDFKCQTAGQIYTAPAAPYGEWFDLPIGMDMRVECPSVFARTAGWVGNFAIVNYNSSGTIARGSIFYYSTAPVEFVFASTQNQNVSSNVGMEIYHPDGGMIYSSAQRYPRIVDMASFTVTSPSMTANLAGGDATNKWICLNPVVPGLSVPLGSGSDISYPPYVHMVAVSGSQMLMRFSDNGIAYTTLAPNTNLSPYNNRIMRVPIAILPGY